MRKGMRGLKEAGNLPSLELKRILAKEGAPMRPNTCLHSMSSLAFMSRVAISASMAEAITFLEAPTFHCSLEGMAAFEC